MKKKRNVFIVSFKIKDNCNSENCNWTAKDMKRVVKDAIAAHDNHLVVKAMKVEVEGNNR